MGAETSSPGQNEDEKHALNCTKLFGRAIKRATIPSAVPVATVVANQRNGDFSLIWIASGFGDDPSGAVAKHCGVMGSDWRAIQVG